MVGGQPAGGLLCRGSAARAIECVVFWSVHVLGSLARWLAQTAEGSAACQRVRVCAFSAGMAGGTAG